MQCDDGIKLLGPSGQNPRGQVPPKRKNENKNKNEQRRRTKKKKKKKNKRRKGFHEYLLADT